MVFKKLTIKALLIRHIIHQQYPHRPTIISRSNSPEPLLSSRIPYLQFHALPVKLDGADLKVNAYRCDEGGCEGVFAKAEETA